jgi:hypothetical protein
MRITFMGGATWRKRSSAVCSQATPRSTSPLWSVAGTRERVNRQFGVRAVAAASEAAPCGDLVVMAVKPQQMREAAAAFSLSCPMSCFRSRRASDW